VFISFLLLWAILLVFEVGKRSMNIEMHFAPQAGVSWLAYLAATVQKHEA